MSDIKVLSVAYSNYFKGPSVTVYLQYRPERNYTKVTAASLKRIERLLANPGEKCRVHVNLYADFCFSTISRLK